MDSSLRFNRPLPVLPVTCGVYQTGSSSEFEVAPHAYYEKIFDYAREYTDNQVVLAYPLEEDGDEKPDCAVFRLGTAIVMNVCDPVVRKGELWSYSIETTDTQKVKLTGFSDSPDGVRLANCVPFEDNGLKLNMEQTMALLLPIWISIRANVGSVDSLTCVMPTFGNRSFIDYIEDLDSCLDRVCAYLPLEFSQRAAFFAAEDVVKRSLLVLRFLNAAHSKGFKLDIIDADLDSLQKWNRAVKVGNN